jgi:hypothetical protein
VIGVAVRGRNGGVAEGGGDAIDSPHTV